MGGTWPRRPSRDRALRSRPPDPRPRSAVLQSGAACPRHTDTAQTDAWDAVSMDGSGRAER